MKLTLGILIVVAAASAFLLACGGSSKAKLTVNADLKEYNVTASASSAEAGKIHFVGHNVGTVTHELAVLKVNDDGSKSEVAEQEGIEAGTTGEFDANLKAGKYELACLIAPGEEGSTVDHYQSGMHTAFEVK